MIKSFKLIVFLLIMSFIACQSKPKNPDHIMQDAYKDHVIAGYEKTIPMLEEIRELKKKLNQLVGNTELVREENKQEIEETIELLEKMDKSINRWKASFSDPAKYRDIYSHKDIMDYLEKESSKIQSAQDHMGASIDQANNLLVKYNKAQ